MPRKTLKCPKCDRRFSMPAHLARHMSATHGPKKKKVRRPKRRKRKVARTRAVRRRGRKPMVGSAARAARELRAYRRELTARRDALDKEIAVVEKAIKAVRGA